MRRKNYLVLLLWVVFGFWQCGQPTAQIAGRAGNSVSKIAYSTTGGRAGNYESLTVAADSLHFMQARRGNEKRLAQKTDGSFWRQLTGAVNLDNFRRIKSDPGHAFYDGIDVTITIEDGTKSYSIVNGNEDSAAYQQIKPFTTVLENKLEQLRSAIRW